MAKRTRHVSTSFLDALFHGEPCILVEEEGDHKVIKIFNVGEKKEAACVRAVKQVMFPTKVKRK